MAPHGKGKWRRQPSTDFSVREKDIAELIGLIAWLFRLQVRKWKSRCRLSYEYRWKGMMTWLKEMLEN
jgi:hypothetical protein